MECPVAPMFRGSPIAPGALDDDALIAAIPAASIMDAPALTGEAARRGLRAAIPALEALCCRFAGFGVVHSVPEQTAALGAMSVIGGAEAARAVARMIVRGVVQGPTLKCAVSAAARLNAGLPADKVLALLRHADPDPGGCLPLRPRWPDAVAVLIDLLDDLNEAVKISAACALGRMGRPEAHAVLTRLLRERPSLPVIDAIPAIADEACIVLLGRIARAGSRPSRGRAGRARGNRASACGSARRRHPNAERRLLNQPAGYPRRPRRTTGVPGFLPGMQRSA